MRFTRLLSCVASRRSSLLSVVAVGVCLVSAGRCHAGEADWRPTRFRVTLRSAEPIAWRGEVVLSEGRLERLQSINNDPSAAAGASIDRGRVALHYRRPLKREVFDVTANCPPGVSLTVRLDRDGEVGSVPIDAAREATQSSRIGPLAAEVRLDRLASDRVRIESDRESLLFAPEESFEFTAVIDPSQPDGQQPYDVSVTLARGRSGGEVWSAEPQRVEPRGGATRTPVTIPLPAEEGVYRVTVSARRPSGFLDRFPTLPRIRAGTPPPVLLSRTFQVAVFDDDRRPQRLFGWREAYAFDPREHGWADRLPDWMRWRRLPWFARGPLSSDGRTDLQAERDGAIEIAPATAAGSHWRAYPLPIDQVGSTYTVEVETLGEPGDRVTLAVLEPDALGDLRALGAAVELTTPRWNRGQSAPTQRLMIRPRSEAPLLVIANPHGERPTRFGRVRLFKSIGEDTKPPAAELAERVIALDWPDSDLPHAVGASHAAVREAGYQPYEVPDLVTHYETAVAMADRVEAAGANAAVLPLNQNGAAIYPSRVWGSPFYDLGVWSNGAADLPRRELPRLVAREFARRGLKVLPAVRFDAPTPVLESLPNASYIAGGSAMRARGAAVAEALSAIGDPGVLAGVVVRASPDGWGLLNTTAPGPDAAERLAKGYHELSDYVSGQMGGKPLIVLPAESVLGEAASIELAPRLGEPSQAATQFLARTGLEDLGARGLLASAYGSPVGPLAALRRARETAKPPNAYALRATRRPVRLLDSATKLRDAAGRDILLPTTVARPLNEAVLLARTAAVGASLIVIDGAAAAGLLDDSIASLRSTLARTPVAGSAAQLEADPSSEDSSRDVVWRAWSTAERTSLATVTNRSAWPRRLRLTVTTPGRLRGERLIIADGEAEWFEAGRHAIDLELRPFETAAWRFDGPGVAIDGVRLEPTPAAEEELAASLADLQSRDTTRRRPVEMIRNASFEAGGAVASEPADWATSGSVARDETQSIHGSAAVRLSSTTEQAAELLSEPFETPATGQLAVFLRTQAIRLGDDARLRVEVLQPNGVYRRSIRLGAESLRVVESDGWSPPLLFPLDDLPLVEGGRLQLRVSLSGEAEVLIDEVQSEDLILPLDGFGPIEKRVEKFALVRLMTTGEKLLAEGRLEACRAVLDSYWPSFLRDNFPTRSVEPVAAAEPSPAVEPTTDPRSEAEPVGEAPSVAERLRGYLPRWWR